jgi:DNA polymerase III delta prime subunit
VEQYHDKVSFILTTNHFDRISDGIKSRFKPLCFDPTPEETVQMKDELWKNLWSRVVVGENIDIKEDALMNIVNRKFPDVRAMMVVLQSIKLTGMDTMSTGNVNEYLKLELYRAVFNKKLTYFDVYDFIMTNFGPDNMATMIDLLGRPFVLFLKERDKFSEKLFEANAIITKNRPLLESRIDPLILGMTVMGEMRKLFI